MKTLHLYHVSVTRRAHAVYTSPPPDACIVYTVVAHSNSEAERMIAAVLPDVPWSLCATVLHPVYLDGGEFAIDTGHSIIAYAKAMLDML